VQQTLDALLHSGRTGACLVTAMMTSSCMSLNAFTAVVSRMPVSLSACQGLNLRQDGWRVDVCVTVRECNLEMAVNSHIMTVTMEQ